MFRYISTKNKLHYCVIVFEPRLLVAIKSGGLDRVYTVRDLGIIFAAMVTFRPYYDHIFIYLLRIFCIENTIGTLNNKTLKLKN